MGPKGLRGGWRSGRVGPHLIITIIIIPSPSRLDLIGLFRKREGVV